MLLESVSFYYKMVDVNNVRLVLGVCIVHVVIFLKKYLVSLFSISFCELLKILTVPVLAGR